ncbi:MAG: LPS export ABC transporter periplasmic protein LptC [Micavibrio sp.]
MDDQDSLRAARPQERLSRISPNGLRDVRVNRAYSTFIRSMRFALPLAALALTVVVITWDDAGRNAEPLKKNDVLPASATIENELMKPVFNSVDNRNRPYVITADRATQSRNNPDIIELDHPVAEMRMEGGAKIDGDAKNGLYAQKEQKLNLQGDVEIRHTDGFILKTEELRIDLDTQKTYSGRDVRVEGPDGAIDATGLEGDVQGETLVFTGPAKVIFYTNKNSSSPKESLE